MSWLTKKIVNYERVIPPVKKSPMKLEATIVDYTKNNKVENLNREKAEYLNFLNRSGELIVKGLSSFNKRINNFNNGNKPSYRNIDDNYDRYSIYDRIESIEAQIPEIKFTVLKYLSESYSSNDNLAFDWTNNQPKSRQYLKDIFNKYYLDIDEIIKNLIRFGDCGVYVHYEDNSYFFKILKPIYYEAITNNPFNIPVAYSLTDRFYQDYNDSQSNNLSYYDEFKDNILPPWEFFQISINKTSNSLYGKGILEDLLFQADKLLASEDLSAFFKASKFDKVVVKVPTSASNPTSAFEQVQMYKEGFKESIFGSASISGLQATQEKISGLTDQVWVPSIPGFDVTNLSSSNDASPDMKDSEYYKQALIQGTGIPASEFTSDSTDGRNSQSLKFRNSLFRKLIKPIIRSTNLFLTHLSNIILINEGVTNLNDNNFVESYLKGNDFIDQEFLDINKLKINYILELIDTLKKGFKGGEDQDFSDQQLDNEEDSVTEDPLSKLDSYKPEVENINLDKFKDVCDYLKVDCDLLNKLLKASNLDNSQDDDFNSIGSDEKVDKNIDKLDLNEKFSVLDDNSNINIDNYKVITGNYLVDGILSGSVDKKLLTLCYDEDDINSFKKIFKI